MVGPGYPFRGGIAQYTTALYKSLQEQGHEPLLISFRRQYPAFLFPGKTQHDSSRDGFISPAQALLDPLYPPSWIQAAERLIAHQPAAVIFQWWQPLFGPAYSSVIGRLKDRSNAAIIFLCHNVYPHERLRVPGLSLLERKLIGSAFKKAEAFLVHSEKMSIQVRKFNSKAPIRRIYHPVYAFYSQWDSPQERTDRTPSILFFGNIRKYKGLAVLLEAMALVRQSMDVRLTVAGEFYVDAAPYKRMAKDLKISDRIDWRDRYIANEEVPVLFRQSDLVVLPYLSATQSGVVPLAYHFDVPVITSDVGGLSEVVLDGRTGYLFPPGQAGPLAERILRFFREEKGPEFQEQIRCFKKDLSWQQVTDKILGLVGSEL